MGAPPRSAVAVALALATIAAGLAAAAEPARRELAEVQRLGRSGRAESVGRLLDVLDREATRETPGAGLAPAAHEALVVLTALDPLPSRSLDPDEAWSGQDQRRALAAAWHEALPTGSVPLARTRRASLSEAREDLWSGDVALRFSALRRLALSRRDRREARASLLELWDLGTEPEALERARAFGRRFGLYPPTPAEWRAHCRVHCCH